MTKRAQINYAIFVGFFILVSIFVFTRGIDTISALSVTLLPSVIFGVVINVLLFKNSEFRLDKYPSYIVIGARVFVSLIFIIIFSIVIGFYVQTIIIGLILSVGIAYLDIYFFYHVPEEEWVTLDQSIFSYLRVIGHYAITLGFYFICLFVYAALFGIF